jgi:putative redox protein
MEITFDGGKVVTAHTKDHIIKTDQPAEKGGRNEYPSPFELYIASIGTCSGIYVKSFCDNRNISTKGIKMSQKVEYDKPTGLPVKIRIEITVPRDFPEEYIGALVKVAQMCKVKKSMMTPPEFEVVSSYMQD